MVKHNVPSAVAVRDPITGEDCVVEMSLAENYEGENPTALLNIWAFALIYAPNRMTRKSKHRICLNIMKGHKAYTGLGRIPREIEDLYREYK
jgi:hypothetical protein